MRLLMLRLLIVTTLLNISLFGSNLIDQNILKYEKKRVASILKRQHIQLDSVEMVLKKDLNQDGWYGYVFDLKFTIKGKQLSQKDTIFTNGKFVAPDLLDIKTKRSLKGIMYPILSDKFYKKDHLIAGNIDAKHKLVLFSDPLCPICIDEVPFIIKAVMENPTKLALYYYHLPLDMHPTAKTISKAAVVAKKMGIKDVEYRLYKRDFSNFYDPYEEKDQQKALNSFNKFFNTNISMADIDKKSIVKHIEDDIKMSEKAFVQGTPTLFVDGKIDKTRSSYEKYLK